MEYLRSVAFRNILQASPQRALTTRGPHRKQVKKQKKNSMTRVWILLEATQSSVYCSSDTFYPIICLRGFLAGKILIRFAALTKSLHTRKINNQLSKLHSKSLHGRKINKQH